MRAWILVALAAAACARTSAPGAPVDYSPADGSFSAALPGGWKVDDAAGETRKAAFFGPGGEMIRISLHPGRTPEAYRASLGGLPTPLSETSVGGAKAFELLAATEFRDPHAGVQKTSLRAVLLPSPRGLWALEHVWPSGAPPSKAVFEDVLRTFKPKNP